MYVKQNKSINKNALASDMLRSRTVRPTQIVPCHVEAAAVTHGAFTYHRKLRNLMITVVYVLLLKISNIYNFFFFLHFFSHQQFKNVKVLQESKPMLNNIK